jgi:hypothetical protein
MLNLVLIQDIPKSTMSHVRGSMFNLVSDPGYTQKYNVSYRGSMFNLVSDPGYTQKYNVSYRGSMFNLVVIQYYTDHASV